MYVLVIDFELMLNRIWIEYNHIKLDVVASALFETMFITFNEMCYSEIFNYN